MRNTTITGRQGLTGAAGLGRLQQAAILTVALLASTPRPTLAAPEPPGSQTNATVPTAGAPVNPAVGSPLAASEPAAASPRERPRTVAAARERQNRQVGNAATAALEAYDAAFVDAVVQRWQDLIDSARILPRPGKVVLDFHVHPDGRITDMNVADGETGPLFRALCQRAVLDPSPYAPWPVAMRRALGAGPRPVSITFCHFEDDGARPQSIMRRQPSHLVCELRCPPPTPACRVQRQHPICSNFAISVPWVTGWPLGYGDDSFSSSQRKRWQRDLQEWLEKDLRRQADFVSLSRPFPGVPK